MLFFRIALALPFLASAILLAAEPAKPEPSVLFNEKDLTGWHNSNCAADTFFVKDKELITTGKPIGFLHTAKQYENFEMEVEWMHINKKEVGNSGIFLWCDSLPAIGTPFTRGIEVQVLVNYPDVGWATNHGDLFSIWGAKCKPDRPHPKGYERCLPSENRAKGGGEWNLYKIVANDGSIKLSVNGKEVSGVSGCKPRKGHIAIESEGAECHFRNFKFKELPSTNPKPEECANEAKGHISLFDHVKLAGLTCDKDSWKVIDENIRCAGTTPISYAVQYSDAYEILFDWKLPEKSEAECTATLAGKEFAAHKLPGVKIGAWNRAILKQEKPGKGPAFSLAAAKGLEIRNIYMRWVKE